MKAKTLVSLPDRLFAIIAIAVIGSLIVAGVFVKITIDEADRARPTTPLFDLSIPLSQISAPIIETTYAFNNVQKAIDEVLASGYDLGFYVQNVEGKPILSYNADEKFYSASAIKGPYVLAVVSAKENGAPYGKKDAIVDAIEWSDNDAYHEIKSVYGVSTINEWLETSGAEARLGWETSSYINITPRQLASLWEQAWPFISTDSDNQRWLKSLFSNPLNSAIGEIDADETWSKPGWIFYVAEAPNGSGQREEYNSTIDAGVVERGDSAYILSVMTDMGEAFETVNDLVKALDDYVQALPDQAMIRVAK